MKMGIPMSRKGVTVKRFLDKAFHLSRDMFKTKQNWICLDQDIFFQIIYFGRYMKDDKWSQSMKFNHSLFALNHSWRWPSVCNVDSTNPFDYRWFAWHWNHSSLQEGNFQLDDQEVFIWPVVRLPPGHSIGSNLFVVLARWVEPLELPEVLLWF